MVKETHKSYAEFYSIVDDLLHAPDFVKLDLLKHHYGVSRMHHCINVAYLRMQQKTFWSSAPRGNPSQTCPSQRTKAHHTQQKRKGHYSKTYVALQYSDSPLC